MCLQYKCKYTSDSGKNCWPQISEWQDFRPHLCSKQRQPVDNSGVVKVLQQMPFRCTMRYSFLSYLVCSYIFSEVWAIYIGFWKVLLLRHFTWMLCQQADRKAPDWVLCWFLCICCFQILLADNLNKHELYNRSRFFRNLLLYLRKDPWTTIRNKNKKCQVLIPRKLQLGLLAQILLLT